MVKHAKVRLFRDAATLLAVAAALTLTGGSAAAFAIARHSASSRNPVSSRTPTATARTSAAPAASASPAPSAAPSSSPSPTGPYRVLGLGDSVPFGSACECTTYVSLVGQHAASQLGRDATISNLAQPGLTTAGLSSQLSGSSVRRAVADADLIIITIGANDFDQDVLTSSDCAPATGLSCYQSTLASQRSQLSSILTQIGTLQTRPGARLVLTGYWNVFLDGEVGREQGSTYVKASNALTLADNALISAVSSAHGDTYVDIYAPFKGGGTRDDTHLLAADGDHPNAAGQALIARTLIDALD